MNIAIQKEQVYQGVMTLTATIGRNRQNMQAIAVSPDNLSALGIYLAEGVTEAENELRRHLKDSTLFSFYLDTDSIQLAIDDKLRSAESAVNQIASSLSLFLIHYIVSRWVQGIEAAKDLAEPYQNSAGGYLSKLQGLVNQRRPYERADEEYNKRLDDENKIGGSDVGTWYKYQHRQQDLQPIQREWHEGVMKTADEQIPTDSEGKILVSKT